MKKLILLLLFSGALLKANAQPYVTINDVVWRNYIDSIVPGAIVGNDLNTAHPGLQNIGSIDVMNRGIYDLDGIQYFLFLNELYCGGNFLHDLPPLPNSLSFLGCNHNQLFSLPALPTDLDWFHCEFNNLTSLPALPPMLTEIDCDNNQLASLPSFPQYVGVISCSNNQLTALPVLPPALWSLFCTNNQLTSLPVLPNTLGFLIAAGNPDLWCLPNIPTNPGFQSDIGYLVCTPQGTPDTWYRMTKNPVNDRVMGVSFSIGIKCYVGSGSNLGSFNDLWAYNPATDTWTQKANIPGGARLQATGFSIGDKGYVGLGQGSGGLFDFWEYNPASNTWVQKASYPDTAYFGNAAFVIGSKAYVGLGQSSGYGFPTRFYEFDPVANTWTQKATFPGGWGRTQAGCFTIGNKGYVCGGDWSNGLTFTCYSYTPSTNSWSVIASLPTAINEAASFSSNGRGYVACGQCCAWNGSLQSTQVEYNPALNTWTQRAAIPTTGRFRVSGCAVNGRTYVGMGEKYSPSGNYMRANDWWEYTPLCITPSNVIYASGNTAFCSGDSVMLFADNGNKYKWKKNGTIISGATSQFYYAKDAGTFTCTISNACDTVNSIQINVSVNPLPSAAITAGGPVTFCPGGSVTLNAPAGANRAYQWKKNGVNIAGATSPSYNTTTGGSFKVTVTNTNTGCFKTTASPVVVTVNPLPAATITPQGPTTFCAGGNVLLKANTGTSLTYQWLKNANNIAGATSNNYTATTAGTYKVRVTNSNGCLKFSAGVVVTVPCRENEEISASADYTISVYPNPAHSEINIVPALNGNYEIEIVNALGETVTTVQNQNKIDIANLSKGLYFIKVMQGNQFYSQKFIKQ